MTRLLVLALLFVTSSLAHGETYHVAQDGTGDFLDINTGIAAAAPGDTLIVHQGYYSEALLITDAISLIAADGPGQTILSGDDSFRIMECNGAVGVHVTGFTFRDGWNSANGGAVFAHDGSVGYFEDCMFVENSTGWDSGACRIGGEGTSFEFIDCVFKNNYAPQGGAAFQVQFGAFCKLQGCIVEDNTTSTIGGGMTVWLAEVALGQCLFRGNTGAGAGAVHLLDAHALIERCTFYGNTTYTNGTITLEDDSTLELVWSILAADTHGYGIDLLGFQPTVRSCNAYFDNQRGSIRGDGLESTEFVADPMFVDPAGHDFHLLPGSPCLPENSPCSYRIGAYGLASGLYLNSIVDVGPDQGGWVLVGWQGVDETQSPVDEYRVQENRGGVWTTAGAVAAEGQSTYSLEVETDDIASPQNPTPWRSYRVVTVFSDEIQAISNELAGYSTDDLAPSCTQEILEVSGGYLVCGMTEDEDVETLIIHKSHDAGFSSYETIELQGTPCYLDSDGIVSYYRCAWVDVHGNEGPFSESAINDDTGIPGVDVYGLGTISPNPFNPSTMITYWLDTSGPIEIHVHDAGGRRVRTLVRAPVGAGRHEINWDGRDDAGRFLAAGVYHILLRSGGRVSTAKAVLLK